MAFNFFFSLSHSCKCMCMFPYIRLIACDMTKKKRWRARRDRGAAHQWGALCSSLITVVKGKRGPLTSKQHENKESFLTLQGSNMLMLGGCGRPAVCDINIPTAVESNDMHTQEKSQGVMQLSLHEYICREKYLNCSFFAMDLILHYLNTLDKSLFCSVHLVMCLLSLQFQNELMLCQTCSILAVYLVGASRKVMFIWSK